MCVSRVPHMLGPSLELGSAAAGGMRAALKSFWRSLGGGQWPMAASLRSCAEVCFVWQLADEHVKSGCVHLSANWSGLQGHGRCGLQCRCAVSTATGTCQCGSLPGAHQDPEQPGETL